MLIYQWEKRITDAFLLAECCSQTKAFHVDLSLVTWGIVNTALVSLGPVLICLY